MKAVEYNPPIDPLEAIKEQRYIRALFAYGILPLTLLLQEYEGQENYTECKIIYNAIKFVNTYCDFPDFEKLPTKYSAEIITQLKSDFNKYGFKGDIVLQNTPYYIEEIKQMIKLWKY